MKSERIPIVTNLIKQNCFVRAVTVNSSPTTSPLTEFESVDEVSSDSGVELRFSIQPYPITPQYVQSFADSADYHKDPAAAILAASSVNRTNLGDVRDFQKVNSMDTAEAIALHNDLKAKFGEAVRLTSSNSGTSGGNNE